MFNLQCTAEAYSGTFTIVGIITTGHIVGINFMVVQLNLIVCGNIIYEDIMHKIPTM